MMLKPMIVELSESLFRQLGFDRLDEGRWLPSDYSDLFYRVDPARPEIALRRHIHIAHSHHIPAKDKQVSWDDIGRRHDRRSFDVNFKGISSARELTREVLKIPPHIVIEAVRDTSLARLLVEQLLDEQSPDVEAALETDFLRLREAT